MEKSPTAFVRIMQTLVAVLASGGATYAVLSFWGREPVRPTLLVSFIVLARLAFKYRAVRRS